MNIHSMDSGLPIESQLEREFNATLRFYRSRGLELWDIKLDIIRRKQQLQSFKDCMPQQNYDKEYGIYQYILGRILDYGDNENYNQ